MNFNNEPIKEILSKVHGLFPGCFITMRNELIFHRKHNIYFGLNKVKNEFDFEVKVVQCLSRDCCKGGLSLKAQKEFRSSVNKLLNVDFSQNDWDNIYTYCNSKSLMAEFVLSGYNLDVIKKVGWHE